MKMTDISKANANRLGTVTMLLQTQEECAELIQAISKYNRTRGLGQKTETTATDAIDKMLDEIADVSICLEQLIYLLDLEDTIQERKEKALRKVYGRYHA